MNSEPSPGYTLVNDGPFCRASVRVYGRTEDAALEAGRSLREGALRVLSKESTVYGPQYQGFDDVNRRHVALVLVTLGGDRAAEEASLGRFLSQLRQLSSR